MFWAQRTARSVAAVCHEEDRDLIEVGMFLGDNRFEHLESGREACTTPSLDSFDSLCEIWCIDQLCVIIVRDNLNLECWKPFGLGDDRVKSLLDLWYILNIMYRK